MSPEKYELGFYIPEYVILHGHRRENVKSYTELTSWALQRRRNVSPVRYELRFYIPEDGILHSHRRENLTSYSLHHDFKMRVIAFCYTLNPYVNVKAF
jgi:hypothetical protein